MQYFGVIFKGSKSLPLKYLDLEVIEWLFSYTAFYIQHMSAILALDNRQKAILTLESLLLEGGRLAGPVLHS